MTDSPTRFRHGFILLLGLFAFASVLAFHHITDADLWSRLAVGASFCERGQLLHQDIFAFTPTLPEWIDHEWGAGVIFYEFLKVIGPSGLMILKIALALAALAFALAVARRENVNGNVLLLLAIPAAACLLPGYIPVLRSHTFTFCFFAATLFLLEELQRGAHWPAFVLSLTMILWVNLHGGFVAGLAMVFLYAGAAVVERKKIAIMAGTAAACAAATLVNPYGVKYWKYLIPALLHPRVRITEWRPLPVLAWDPWWGFRILFVLTVLAVVFGWAQVERKNFRGLVVMGLAAGMGWHVRRHGPFLGVAALAFAGPYLAAVLQVARWRINPFYVVCAAYVGVALYAAVVALPNVSLHPLAPLGEDPVREADILSRARAKGNLASPFGWGSYLTWRLYPDIKVSMDGRYETVYPESSFDLNTAFFEREGDWFKLGRDYKVDFVILDLMNHPLRPEDLTSKGYVLIWKQEGLSALLCRPEHAALLAETARNLPPVTIDPLDLTTRPAWLFPRSEPQ